MIRATICAAAMAATFATSATAQDAQCADRARMVEFLQGEFGEATIGGGVSQHPSSGEIGIIEMWVNAETGTWTLTVTRANGAMCVLISGGNWTSDDLLTPSGRRL